MLVTHGHIDHVGGAGPFSRQVGAAVYVHPDDDFLSLHPARQLRSMFGVALTDEEALPFAPPVGGWAPQTESFMSGMAIADLVNAALSLVFVFGFFRSASWAPWLGTVVLTVVVYAAVTFTWGAVAAGAPALGISYLWVNVPTIPLFVLFGVWTYWHFSKRFP